MFTRLLVVCAALLAGHHAQAAFAPSAGANIRFGGNITADNGSLTLPINLAITNTYTVSANGAAGGALSAGNYNYMVSWREPGIQWKIGQGRIVTCYDMNYVAGANQAIQFGYATSTFTDNAASAPGGATCFSGVACASSSIIGSRLFQTGTTYAKMAIVFDASSSGANRDIFPFWRGNAANTFQLDLICYEQ